MRSPSTAVTPAAPDGSWHNCVGLPGHPAVLDTPGEPCPHCEVDDPPTAASTPTSTNQPKENTVPQPTQTSNVKVHIDPNARDASGALRCAAASAMFVEGMRKEVGKLANNAARGLRGEVPAVRAIRAAEADIAATLGRFDALVTEHMGHKLTQDELAQDVNLLHAAIGYLDAERRI